MKEKLKQQLLLKALDRALSLGEEIRGMPWDGSLCLKKQNAIGLPKQEK